MEAFVCRICVNKTATTSLYAKHSDIDYSSKIMRIVNIIINENDSLPQHICSKCIAELTIAYEFINRCEVSDRALRLELENNIFFSSSASNMKNELNVISLHDVKTELKEESTLISGCNDLGSEVDFLFEDLKDECDVSRKATTCLDKERNKDKVSLSSEVDFFFDNLQETFNLKDDCDLNILSVNEPQSKDNASIKENHNQITKRKQKLGKVDPIQCAICGLLKSSQSALDIHLRTHTGEKPFCCAACKSTFPTKGSLKRHIETHHLKRERKFTCETCGTSFYRKNDIIIHIRRHTGEKPHACSYCNKRFLQVGALIRHRRTHTGDKPYSCTICTKSFGDKSLLSKHASVHTDDKKFVCHLCHKAVKSNYSLKVHMKIHSNEKRNICSICGIAFSLKGNLKTHMRRVHSEKSGHCTICSKLFSNLEEHMRSHTGEKPFVCNLCNKSFTNKRSLANHVLYKHENVQKYRCSIGDCDRSFPTATMLEFHLLKYHTNHTPYVCKHCSRGFYRTSDLSRHLRISHMELPSKVKIE